MMHLTYTLFLAQNSAQELLGTKQTDVPKVADITLGRMFGWGVNIFFICISLLALYYFLYAAFEWVTSGGEEEKLAAARQKITHAAVGLIIAVAMIAIWLLLTANLMPFVKYRQQGFEICLPTINGSSC